LTLLVPTRIMPFLLSPIVSPLGKLRMGLEWFIPPRSGDEDESIGAFVRRRLGQEAVERLGQPILGSIFSGDIDRLSLLATLPQLRDMEMKYGGLLRGMLRGPRPKAPGGSAFLSLQHGLGQLVAALVAALAERGVELHGGVPATTVVQNGARWSVHHEGGMWDGDVVVVALPAPHAAQLVRSMDGDLAAVLEQIRYGTSATVSFGFPASAIRHPLDGSGFVVAPRAARRLVACTWSSTKWLDRNPAGHVLLLASLTPALAQGLSDEDMVRVALEEISAALGVRGAPVLTRVGRFQPSTPHYDVGHLERVATIERLTARNEGLYLTGNAYRGSGIPDCIRHARQTAAAVVRRRESARIDT
jgi:oxygen-dependent protoporphyrinogen oxidase